MSQHDPAVRAVLAAALLAVLLSGPLASLPAQTTDADAWRVERALDRLADPSGFAAGTAELVAFGAAAVPALDARLAAFAAPDTVREAGPTLWVVGKIGVPAASLHPRVLDVLDAAAAAGAVGIVDQAAWALARLTTAANADAVEAALIRRGQDASFPLTLDMAVARHTARLVAGGLDRRAVRMHAERFPYAERIALAAKVRQLPGAARPDLVELLFECWLGQLAGVLLYEQPPPEPLRAAAEVAATLLAVVDDPVEGAVRTAAGGRYFSAEHARERATVAWLGAVALGHFDPDMRQRAAERLGTAALDDRARAALLLGLQDGYATVRAAAMQALQADGGPAALIAAWAAIGSQRGDETGADARAQARRFARRFDSATEGLVEVVVGDRDAADWCSGLDGAEPADELLGMLERFGALAEPFRWWAWFETAAVIFERVPRLRTATLDAVIDSLRWVGDADLDARATLLGLDLPARVDAAPDRLPEIDARIVRAVERRREPPLGGIQWLRARIHLRASSPVDVLCRELASSDDPYRRLCAVEILTARDRDDPRIRAALAAAASADHPAWTRLGKYHVEYAGAIADRVAERARAALDR